MCKHINHSDFTEIISKKDEEYKTKYTEGLKKNIMRLYDVLKYISLRRLDFNVTQNVTLYALLNETEWIELNNLTENIIRPWFNNIIDILHNEVNNFLNDAKVIQISLFIVIIFILIMSYFIIWKKYEESLSILLEKSIDLIQLMPEEIKNVIVRKFNE